MFLEISLNSQEKTCAGVSFLIKLQVLAFWERERERDRERESLLFMDFLEFPKKYSPNTAWWSLGLFMLQWGVLELTQTTAIDLFCEIS